MRHAPGRRGAARALALLAALVLAPVAKAGSPVVVELFTSQGCSSCPPADALLHDLAERPDVIALSLHVDYWDYLGWRDVYAQPAFSRRQMGYRDAAGARSVYTPQIVVDGVAAVVGSRREKVMAAVEAALARPDAVTLELERAADGVRATLVPAPGARPPAAPAVVWFVTFRTPDPLTIERGENAGKRFQYRNVARSWMKMGHWDGAGPARFDAPAPSEDAGVAVIVQAGPVGPILGAAKLEPR